MTAVWAVVGIIALLVVIARVIDEWLAGPRVQVARPMEDGLRLLLSVVVLIVLLVLLGLPLSLGQTVLLSILGMLFGYASTVLRGFTIVTGSAVVYRARGLLAVAGLSGAVVILGSLWLGTATADIGMIGLVFTTAAMAGRYVALFRASTVAEATLVAEAIVLSERMCRACGSALRPGERVCDECGTEFGGFCATCGMPVETDRRCDVCGAPRISATPMPDADQLVQRFCIGCGSPIDMSSAICPLCSMTQPPPCPVCGSALLAGDESCYLCGFALLDADADEVQEIVSRPTTSLSDRTR